MLSADDINNIEDWVQRVERSARQVQDAADDMRRAAEQNEAAANRMKSAAESIPYRIRLEQ